MKRSKMLLLIGAVFFYLTVVAQERKDNQGSYVHQSGAWQTEGLDTLQRYTFTLDMIFGMDANARHDNNEINFFFFQGGSHTGLQFEDYPVDIHLVEGMKLHAEIFDEFQLTPTEIRILKTYNTFLSIN